MSNRTRKRFVVQYRRADYPRWPRRYHEEFATLDAAIAFVEGSPVWDETVTRIVEITERVVWGPT